jgi:WD40 repeat protein
MRKVFLVSGIVVFVAALAFVGIKYFPAKKEKPVIQTFSTKQNPAYKAVPQKSPLIIEIKDQEGFFNAIKGDRPMFAEFRKVPEFENLFSGISRFRDFVHSRSGISELLTGKSIIISVNPSGKNQLANLFLVQLNNSGEASSAVDVVSRELGGEYAISRKNYDNTAVINAKSANLSFYFTCANDIFMASEDFILIEEAIRQSNSVNLLNNRQFTEVYKTIEETALANIFINHQTIAQVLSKLVAPEIRKSLSQLSSYSNWSGLDLWEKSGQLELTGYSVTKDSTDNYLNIFRNQEAQKLTIDKAMPVSSSYFVALNLKNTGQFIDQYENYLRTSGNYYPREMNLIEFKKKTNVDLERLMKDLVGNQVAGVYTNINKSNPSQNRFFVAELVKPSEAKEKLGKAVAEFSRSGKAGTDPIQNEYSVGGKKSFEIYRLPIGNMPECLFGRAFSGINSEYFVLFDKYLIFGDNLPGMKNYLQSLVAGKTLANDSIYQLNNKELQPKPNFYLYSRIPKTFRLKDVLLRPEISEKLSKSEDVIRKFSTFSWQFSISNKMVKNSIVLKYDPDIKEEPQAIWQLKLEGKLMRKPVLVLNHKDLPNREVIVCDDQNNVSLINKEGLALWTINIPGEIVSDIHQIDLFHNNKFQYLFNTKTQLYCIDRMGNKVGKFPVTLKSIASNGVTVAEYGNNREYRFIIAGEDHKIYLFDLFGKLIPKWNFEGAESEVTQPVQHFDVDGKDYLVISDKQNIYFLDRQGKRREAQPAPFDRSVNPLYFVEGNSPRLISTDQSGRIHIIDFDGQAEVKEVGKFGTAHRFVVSDLDGNGSVEYIFADGRKLTIFSADGKKTAEHTFADVISETPVVCAMGAGNVKIGVVIKGENKVYLLDKNGSVMRGLPLEGDAGFILGKFNDANAWYNLIIGSQGNMLVNYRIE